MDILSHTLSGLAVATTFAACNRMSAKARARLILAGAVAGAMPDLDAISMWSGFDGKIGGPLGLTHPGREIYSAKFWYSHHAFLHSFLCSLIAASLATLVAKKWIKSRLRPSLIFLSFLCAYNAHLLGDLPTPASSWDGIAWLWPSAHYSGGYGKIWWWNNYDLVLIIFSISFLNLVWMLAQRFIKKTWTRKVPLAIFGLGLAFCLFQVNTRKHKYNTTNFSGAYAAMEVKSKAEQRRILGPTLYNFMAELDKKLPFHF